MRESAPTAAASASSDASSPRTSSARSVRSTKTGETWKTRATATASAASASPTTARPPAKCFVAANPRGRDEDRRGMDVLPELNRPERGGGARCRDQDRDAGSDEKTHAHERGPRAG